MAPRRFITDEVDQLFDVLFSTDWDSIMAMPVVSQLPRNLVSDFPPCDLEIGEDKSLTYSFAVAGYDEEDIKIQYEDEHLVLSLASKKEEEESKKKFIQRKIKRGVGKFRYHVPLAKYDINKISVKLKNGILTVQIPVKEDQKPVEIAITKD